MLFDEIICDCSVQNPKLILKAYTMLCRQGLGQEALMVRNCKIESIYSSSFLWPNFFEDLGVNDITQVLNLDIDQYLGSHINLNEHLLSLKNKKKSLFQPIARSSLQSTKTNSHVYSMFALNLFNISSVSFNLSILTSELINLLSENGTCERLAELGITGCHNKMQNLLNFVEQ